MKTRLANPLKRNALHIKSFEAERSFKAASFWGRGEREPENFLFMLRTKLVFSERFSVKVSIESSLKVL